MTQELFSFLLQQLAYQLPILLVFLGGAIAAAVMLRRHRTASVLCLLGCAISIVTILVVTGLQGWLFGARLKEGWTMARYAQGMSVVGLAGAILRPIGLALVLVAVFVGRHSSVSQG